MNHFNTPALRAGVLKTRQECECFKQRINIFLSPRPKGGETKMLRKAFYSEFAREAGAFFHLLMYALFLINIAPVSFQLSLIELIHKIRFKQKKILNVH